MPVVPKMLRVSRKVLPLFVLGVVRLISVKGTDYPEHESEYGRHWNFFFTMACIPVLEVLLHNAMVHAPISLVGYLVVLMHQWALSFASLQDYALNTGRLGIISANKEGLVSLSGYLAIHVIGLLTGTILLPVSPSEFKRAKRQLQKNIDGKKDEQVSSTTKPQYRQNDKIAIELFSYAALWWTCLGLSSLLDVRGGGVSRRLANLPYVLWVCAYNTTFILCYLLVDMVFTSRMLSPHTKNLSPTQASTKRVSTASELLDAINTNGLAFFLAANVLTGLINLSVRTMYASDAVSLMILSLYSFAICGIAWATRSRRLWLP